MDTFIFILEIVGLTAFAITGALDSIESRMDMLGVLIMGVVTSIGGGITRDIILGQIPRSFADPFYFYASLIISLATFAFVYYKRNIKGENISNYFDDILTITDAIGLAVFSILGMNVAYSISLEFSPILYLVCGTLTACGGGILRDIMSQKLPYVFDRNIYASASILGSVIYFLLRRTPVAQPTSMIISILIIFIVRYIADRKNLQLPKIRTNNDI